MDAPRTAEAAAELLPALFPPEPIHPGRRGHWQGGAGRPVVRINPLAGAYLYRQATGPLVLGPVPYAPIDGTVSPRYLAALPEPAQLVTFPFGRPDEGTEIPTGPGIAPGVGPAGGDLVPGARLRVAVVDLANVPATPKGAAALVASALTARLVAADVAAWANDAERAADARRRHTESAAYADYADNATARISGAFAGWIADHPDPTDTRHAEPFPTVPVVVRTRPGVITP